MELTYEIKTAADVAALEKFYDEQIKAIDALKQVGELTAEQDAKLRETQRTVDQIAAAFRKFHETLSSPPAEYLAFLDKLKDANFASVRVRGLDTPAPRPETPTGGPAVLDKGEYERRLATAAGGEKPTGDQSKAVALSIENDVKAAIAAGAEAVLVQISNGVEKRMALKDEGGRVTDERGMTFHGGSVFGDDQRVEISAPKASKPKEVEPDDLRDLREFYEAKIKLAEADGDAAKAANIRAEYEGILKDELADRAQAEKELASLPPPPPPGSPPNQPPNDPPKPPDENKMASGAFRRLRDEADELEKAIEKIEEAGGQVPAKIDTRLDFLKEQMESANADLAKQIVALEDSGGGDAFADAIAELKRRTGEAVARSGEMQGPTNVVSGETTGPEAPPTVEAPEFNVVTQEQYDLLVRAREAAEAYLKTISDPGDIAATEQRIASINDSLERSEPAAQQAAEAYYKMTEAMEGFATAGQEAEGAGSNITDAESLKATEKLLQLEKERLATQRPGSDAYAETRERVAELTAAVNSCNAEMVRELELLKQKAPLLKAAGDEAGLAANKQAQTALKGALGQQQSSFAPMMDKLGELRQAYAAGGGGVEGFINVLKGGGGAIAGWAAGIGLLGMAAKKASDEFEQAQVAITKLDAAMAQSGTLTDGNREKLHALAGELESTTAVADEKWLGVMARLTQFGADTSNMGKYTDAVKNLAGIMGGDVESAATAVSRAMQGQFGMFSRYGVYVDEAGTQTEKLTQLFEQLARRGGGQLEALGNTIEGQKAKLGNSMSNLWEAIGGRLAGGGNSKWREFLAGGLDWWTELVAKTTPVVDGLTNSVMGNKRSLEEDAAAAEKHKTALKGIAEQADETAKSIAGMTEVIRQNARMQDEKADAKLALEKAKVDDLEKRGVISHEEAIRRRMKLEADAETAKMANKTKSKEAEKAFLGEQITDVQATGKAATETFEAAKKKLDAYKPRLEADQKTVERLNQQIAERKTERQSEATAAEENARAAGDPRAAAAIREQAAKDDAAAAKEIAGMEASRDRFKAGADKRARAAGFEDKGLDTNVTDTTADVKRLKEQMEKTLEANKATLAKLTKDYHDLEVELVHLTEVNALRTEALNIKNAGESAVLAAKEKSKAEASKAKQQAADIALKLEKEDKTLKPGEKSDLLQQKRQADFNAQTAAIRGQYLDAAGDPGRQRELELELSRLIEHQRNLNKGLPTGQQIALGTAKPPTVATPPATPTVKAPESETATQIAKAGAEEQKKATAEAIAAREKAAANARAAQEAAADERGRKARDAANASRAANGEALLPTYDEEKAEKKRKADELAEGSRARSREIARRLATQFEAQAADESLTPAKRAEAEAKGKRQRAEYDRLGGAEADRVAEEKKRGGAAPTVAKVEVDSKAAEKLATDAGKTLGEAVDRLAVAVAGPLETASGRIDRLSERLDQLDSQMQDRTLA